MVAEGESVRERGAGSWGFLDVNYYIKIYSMDEKVLVYSPGSYIQYQVINHNGKESLKKNVCYVYD